MKTAEGELLQHVLQLESIVKAKKEKDNEQIFADIMGDGDKDKAHKNYEQAREMDREGKFNKKPSGEKMGKGGMCKGAMCKRMCKDDPTCGTGLNKGGLYMGDMGEKNKYCQEKFGKNYSECSPSQKAQCDKHCGDMKKGNYMMNEDKGNYMMNEELENPKLADRDKDGKLSSWEKTVGKKIEQSKKGKETGDYKSDRGNKKIPFKEETKKPVKKEDFTAEFIRKNTDKMMPMGAHNSTSRRMSQDEAMGGGKGDRMGGAYTVDPRAFNMASRQHYTDSEDKDEHGNKIRGTGKAVPGSKNTLTGDARREITRTPRPGFGQRSDFSTEGDGSSILAPKPDWMKEASADATSLFISQKTGLDLVKYEQESISDNGVPQFVDHYGIRAVNYQTNGRIPHYEQNAQNINAISEKAKMPAFAKTGYDAKGSSLHMQLIDGGDRADGNWNIAPIEERLTELKKGATNPGLVDEIANLMESIANRL
tara:strand:- start:3339 stop:4778 length:1440 start_codon:yes stop_codon:yes gene_type:complete